VAVSITITIVTVIRPDRVVRIGIGLVIIWRRRVVSAIRSIVNDATRERHQKCQKRDPEQNSFHWDLLVSVPVSVGSVVSVRVIGPVIAVRPIIDVRIRGDVIIVAVAMPPVIRVPYGRDQESHEQQAEQQTFYHGSSPLCAV
jgi:hypothetical protein